jgi:hypothetical protein
VCKECGINADYYKKKSLPADGGVFASGYVLNSRIFLVVKAVGSGLDLPMKVM